MAVTISPCASARRLRQEWGDRRKKLGSTEAWGHRTQSLEPASARRAVEYPTKTNHPRENARLRGYRLASANPIRAGIGPGLPWNPVG